MKKFVAALSLVLFSFAVVSADELKGKITKVDGNTITFVKAKAKGTPKGTKSEPTTYTAIANVPVKKGKYDKKAKTFSDLTPVTGGLTSKAFSGKKGASVQITTNGSQITEIVLIEGTTKKKKKTQ